MRRTLWPLAAFGIVVVIALTAAGCGGAQSSSGSSTAGYTSTASHRSAVTPREEAVKLKFDTWRRLATLAQARDLSSG